MLSASLNKTFSSFNPSFQPVLQNWCKKDRGMLSCLWDGVVEASSFLSRYMNGPLPCARCHIIVNKNVLSASLNLIFLSYFYNDYPSVYVVSQ